METKINYDSAVNQRIKDEFVNREVFCCVSQEVEYILSRNDDENAPYSFEDIDNLYDENNEPQDVYEWWKVTPWLLAKLKDLGEPVIEHAYIWGRTTTGQAISLDYVISKICADLEILEGQANDWSKE